MRSAFLSSFILLDLVSSEHASSAVQRKLQQCFALDPNVTFFCPINRYCSWATLEDDQRSALEGPLGYSEIQWNYQDGVNEKIEHSSFADLDASQQRILGIVGFDSDSHDCCLGHYTSHAWSDFSDEKYAGVKAAWELLGYDEASWASVDLQNIIAPYGGVSWNDLPDEVKSALSNDLCYNKELWDGVDLSLWTSSTVFPGALLTTTDPTASPTSKVTSSPSDVSSSSPSITESSSPTLSSSSSPSVVASSSPSDVSSSSPSITESSSPSAVASVNPSMENSSSPSVVASESPSMDSSPSPSAVASDSSSMASSSIPTMLASDRPSMIMSSNPSMVESDTASVEVSLEPEESDISSPSSMIALKSGVHFITFISILFCFAFSSI